MAEYIERENAIAWFMPYEHAGESIDADVVISDIKGMKAADVAPVRHGKWLPTTKWWQGGSAWKQCSECGILHLGKSNFCPNCGAKMEKMDLEEEQHELRRDL